MFCRADTCLHRICGKTNVTHRENSSAILVVRWSPDLAQSEPCLVAEVVRLRTFPVGCGVPLACGFARQCLQETFRTWLCTGLPTGCARVSRLHSQTSPCSRVVRLRTPSRPPLASTETSRFDDKMNRAQLSSFVLRRATTKAKRLHHRFLGFTLINEMQMQKIGFRN